MFRNSIFAVLCTVSLFGSSVMFNDFEPDRFHEVQEVKKSYSEAFSIVTEQKKCELSEEDKKFLDKLVRTSGKTAIEAYLNEIKDPVSLDDCGNSTRNDPIKIENPKPTHVIKNKEGDDDAIVPGTNYTRKQRRDALIESGYGALLACE